jgi:hypothetical protein
MKKIALYLHRFLGLAIEVATFFIVAFPPYPWYTGLLVALTINTPPLLWSNLGF